MEFEKILSKRLKGMAVRILANIEHTLGADLGEMSDDEQFVLTGGDLNIIRSEILNATGDTTRSLLQLVGSIKPSQGGLSFNCEDIYMLNQASIDIIDDIPIFCIRGDFNLLNKIRNDIGAGIVYNMRYTCVGIDDIVDSLIPYLDTALLTGIKIADGKYREWRDAVCEIYLEGLGYE